MKKIFWVTVLLFAYIWAVSTGHEQFFLDQSKKAYNIVAEWFNDTTLDFQVQQPVEPVKKKRSRRWD